MLNEALQAAPGLYAIGAGVGIVGLAVWATRTPPAADEHDVADYRPALHPSRRDWPLVDRKPMPTRRALRRAEAYPVGTLPPAPAGTTAPMGLYAALVVDQVAARYGDSPAEIANRFLRELGDEARAQLAGAR